MISSTRSFWKSLIGAVKGYLRSKARHLPKTPPQGQREIIEAILEQKAPQDFLQEYARSSGLPLEQVEKTFREYLHEIAADQNYLWIPLFDLTFSWAIEMIYEGVGIDPAMMDRIRSSVGKVPIVFVPSHRSHMDYVLLPTLLYHHQIPVPHLCSGSNLAFWPLGAFLRKGGGFFIRRSYEGNRLYAVALQTYVEQLVRQRLTIGFFIEGTRSRTGKLLPPRLGILNNLVQSYENGAASDILFIPTSFTYESILEEANYLAEQAGESKKEENFWDLLALRKYLRKKKGKVYLQFSEPISLKDFLGDEPMSPDTRREKVREFAYELTYGINRSAVATPAALVATSLLTHDGRSVSYEELEDKIERYLRYLRFKECRLSEPLQKYQKSAVRESLRKYVKEGLVQECRDGDSLLYRIPEDKRPFLDYYKNTAIHFFVSISALTTLLRSLGREEVSLKEVEEGYTFLQELFQYEFTFSRRQSLQSHLEKLLTFLETEGALRRSADRIVLIPEGRSTLDLFSSPLRNFLEGYLLVLENLPFLGTRRWESKDLIQSIQERGKVFYLKEWISRWESVNKFVSQNSLSAFRDLGLLKEEKEGWGKKKKIFYTVVQSGEELRKRLKNFASPNV